VAEQEIFRAEAFSVSREEVFRSPERSERYIFVRRTMETTTSDICGIGKDMDYSLAKTSGSGLLEKTGR
jgi:hypothetical protein